MKTLFKNMHELIRLIQVTCNKDITGGKKCRLSHVQLFMTRWTVACKAPLSMGSPRQEYWIRLPFPTPGDLSHLGIEPAYLASPALAGGFFTTAPPGKPYSGEIHVPLRKSSGITVHNLKKQLQKRTLLMYPDVFLPSRSSLPSHSLSLPGVTFHID